MAVAPERFRRQVTRLRALGYRFVTVGELGATVRTGGDIRGLCALSFDDGADDNATVLPPLLRELDVPATLFICPGLLGRPHPFFPSEAGCRVMSESQLLELNRDPRIEIGSHTTDHTELHSADLETAREVMSSSRQVIEQMVGKQVTSFAYPRCRYSPACPEAARLAGFECAVACGPQRGRWRPYEMPRTIVDPGDGRTRFELKHRGFTYRVWNTIPGRLARAALQAVRRVRRRAKN
jgi:peptidoglycan/xylan/chitin deacetylase (PgdA/CDA1 family)